ncbi:electron transport complex protein RnfC [Vibrio sp. JCM 18905]|nr:electron transport complex protein RnfC [Vibrio sp. JCM 18905]
MTNKEVPSGAIPADIGILVQNVGSLYSIKRAIIDGEPMIKRVVTLTGKTFKQPRNVWALLGTPVQALLDEFGYKADKKLQRLIMGGPMMGFTLPPLSSADYQDSKLYPCPRLVVRSLHTNMRWNVFAVANVLKLALLHCYLSNCNGMQKLKSMTNSKN